MHLVSTLYFEPLPLIMKDVQTRKTLLYIDSSSTMMMEVVRQNGPKTTVEADVNRAPNSINT